MFHTRSAKGEQKTRPNLPFGARQQCILTWGKSGINQGSVSVAASVKSPAAYSTSAAMVSCFQAGRLALFYLSNLHFSGHFSGDSPVLNYPRTEEG